MSSPKTALSQYCLWVPSGGLIGAGKLFGIHEQDGETKSGSSLVARGSVGGRHRMAGGAVNPSLTIPFIPMDGDFIVPVDGTTNYCMRNRTGTAFRTAALTAFDVFTGNGYRQLKYTGCKVNSLELSCGEEEALRGNLEIFATGRTEDASGTVTEPAWTANWEWFHGVVTLAAGTYGVRSFRWRLGNNLTYHRTLETATTNSKRLPDALVEGFEANELEVTTDEYVNDAVRAATADTLLTNIAFNAAFNNGAQTLTLALAGLADAEGDSNPVKAADGVMEYTWRFQLEPNACLTSGRGPTLTIA